MNDTDWSLIDFGDKKAGGEKSSPVIAKGTCRKCGKHVGKGVHFHEKTCEGGNA
jgi:hypothetical protein